MFSINQDFEYYYLNQTCVDEDTARKHLAPIGESVVSIGGKDYTTLTYKQVLQSFGQQNWNGRTYVLQDTVNALNSNPLIQHDIANKSWAVEYGHPILEKGMNELQRQMTILPERSCNTINKYWTEGNLLMGESTTLYGGWGEVLMGRILTKFPAMASSRAVGGMDKNGRVLPGYTIVTFDTVIRPSHKEAYHINKSEIVNSFAAPVGNTMSECVMKLDIAKDEAFKNFVLSESAGSGRVERVLETLGLDYSSIAIDGKNLKIKKINESSINTVFIPLRKIVSMEYHNLF